VHKSRRHAHESQQILSAAQEETLADWCNLASTSATPIHPVKLRASVKEITSQLPSRKWHYGFIHRHPSLCISRASGLDPKRARNFNKDTIGEFFEMRKKLDDDHNIIPPEHHWNMDEKGNQMGGGRKNAGTKFIFSAEDSDRYRVHSDNLELVTTIECISAAGAKMPPWFVLSEGPAPDIRDLKDKVGG